MIRLHWPEPPDLEVDANEDQINEAFERYRASATVEVIHGDLGDKEKFAERFQQGRTLARTASSASLALQEI